MPEYTIRNRFETVPLTEDMAKTLGFRVSRDSSGMLAAIYELDDETEADRARSMGFAVELVASKSLPA